MAMVQQLGDDVTASITGAATWHTVRLVYLTYFFYKRTMFFYHSKSTNIIFQYHLDMAMTALATRKHVNCELLFVMGLWPRQFWMGCFSLQGNGCATKNYHSLQWTSQFYHFHHGLWKFVIQYIWFLYSCHSIILFLFSSFFLQLVRQWIKTNQ
jgi:hypothetical protein